MITIKHGVLFGAVAMAGVVAGCAADAESSGSTESDLTSTAKVTVERVGSDLVFRAAVAGSELAALRPAFAEPLPGLTLEDNGTTGTIQVRAPQREIVSGYNQSFYASPRGFWVSLQGPIATALSRVQHLQVHHSVHDNAGASHFNAEFDEAEFLGPNGDINTNRFFIRCTTDDSFGPMCKIMLNPEALANESEEVAVGGNSVDLTALVRGFEARKVLDALGAPNPVEPLYDLASFSKTGTNELGRGSFGIYLDGHGPANAIAWDPLRLDADVATSVTAFSLSDHKLTLGVKGAAAALFATAKSGVPGLTCSANACLLKR